MLYFFHSPLDIKFRLAKFNCITRMTNFSTKVWYNILQYIRQQVSINEIYDREIIL